MSLDIAESTLFTCLSCTIAFSSAEDQRIHYRSDHHRYNMKRRVSGLPPVSVAVFDQKVLERRAETAVMVSPKASTCDLCRKTYTTENAYRSHINSRKHRENELTPSAKMLNASVTSPSSCLSQLKEENVSLEELERALATEIASAHESMDPNACLFCQSISTSIEGNLEHMASMHSFFIPDAEYLADLPGLLAYLGGKINIGNMCIYCNGRGRELRTLEAVRKHMIDKSHCKIAYDTEADRLEVSDFYDFTSSYPDGDSDEQNKSSKRPQQGVDKDEWEDVEDDDSEVHGENDDHGNSSDSDDLPSGQVTYGDTEYELVLPSGARIGHRSMKRYYDQSFYGIHVKEQDSNSGAALVRRLLKDKNSALVPRKGGFGAFGGGTEVVKARNKGEAREAGRHIREFRDQRRREEFKTKVGFVHNSQKHYRDPLLQ